MAITINGTTGISTTGDYDAEDGDKILLGTSDDLQIYHDGSNSYLTNSTGHLYLKSDDIRLQSASGEAYIWGSADSAVELYHNNVKKVATESYGQQIFGNLYISPGMVEVHNTGDKPAIFDRAGSAGTLITCRFGNTQCGKITVDTNTTTYVTSSDYRLKENQVAISDGITRLKQLKPYKFNWKGIPDKTIDGFFAHEVTPTVPQAVIGEKDGEEMQGIDHSKLVPLLTAALQEAITKIETLETKVAALEAA